MISAGKKYIMLLMLVCSPAIRAGSAIIQHGNEPNIAEVLEKQYRYALSLFEKGEHFDAVTEFKRLTFFDRTNRYLFTASYHIAESYKAGARLDDAVKYFSIADVHAGNDSLSFLAKTGIVRCNILRRTTRQALTLLEQMQASPRYKLHSNEIHYWRGWAYIFEDDWKKASESFAFISPDHPLKKLSDSLANEKYSVSFAKVISYILPGSGQFYTGKYLSGIMSLGWTAMLAYFSVSAFAEERIFDGFVIAPLFFRFHRGNVQNAEEFALIRNLEISNKALYFLQKNYEGLKP